ncbi:MAG: hypothetical protein PQJ61_02775 [Spirochaetales bacterium]|uniref:Alcohol acetyltransferase n=1 Tax=Candidatus Thalassospirochaeta sargassi TaxID=3119039 RepID=A0AAJ1IE30_9SPIO|nr:hypothetical protein [Spirochaetales bacterium]
MATQWAKLDNAGKIYPANINLRNTTLFRITVDLHTEVDPVVLQKAVDDILPRFPYFHVKLKKGFFWYYFVKTDEQIRIQEDIYYPCTEWNFKKKGFMFNVKYKDRRIAVEFSHSMTDGTGGLEFFKALLLQYHKLSGVSIADSGNIKVPGEEIDPEETTDGFKEFYDVHIPSRERRTGKAFHLKFKPTDKGVYHVTTGIMDFNTIRTAAKEKNINMTGLICLFYFQVFQQLIFDRKARPAPLVINLPVNLRNIFSSRTMSNFFVSVTPTIDPRLGFFSEDDIKKHVDKYLSLEIDRRYVGKMIKRNIKIEQSIGIRIIPLFLKEILLPIVYRVWGERGYTSGLSNLGKIEFPPEIEKNIETFNVIPPPSPGNIIKMICFSFKNKFYITFGSLTDDKTIEENFFRLLRKNGISAKIKIIS